MIIAKEKPFNIDPPNKYIKNKASNVVTDVIKVLDKVSFVEILDIYDIEIFKYFFKFSLIRSNITTVSFIE